MISNSQFIKDASSLRQIPPDSLKAYRRQLDKLILSVDERLSAHPEIHRMIGHNSLQMMRDNIRYHGLFMSSVLSLGSYDLLARTLPWLYRTYHAHRYSYDYFPLEIAAWSEACQTLLEADDHSAIMDVYHWIGAKHADIVRLSEQPDEMGKTQETTLQQNFLAAALAGNHRACLELASADVNTMEEIANFYQQILCPVLHEIGRLWERAAISVAQEHLATAIVGRVMVSLKPEPQQAADRRGQAVITTTENERHELGALMVADILEGEGWAVTYLGADVPRGDLLQTLREKRPDLLALSISVPCNLAVTRESIAAIRRDPELKQMKIMVGGYLFENNPELWQILGADGLARNLKEVKNLTRQWWPDG